MQENQSYTGVHKHKVLNPYDTIDSVLNPYDTIDSVLNPYDTIDSMVMKEPARKKHENGSRPETLAFEKHVTRTVVGPLIPRGFQCSVDSRSLVKKWCFGQ